MVIVMSSNRQWITSLLFPLFLFPFFFLIYSPLFIFLSSNKRCLQDKLRPCGIVRSNQLIDGSRSYFTPSHHPHRNPHHLKPFQSVKVTPTPSQSLSGGKIEYYSRYWGIMIGEGKRSSKEMKGERFIVQRFLSREAALFSPTARRLESPLFFFYFLCLPLNRPEEIVIHSLLLLLIPLHVHVDLEQMLTSGVQNCFGFMEGNVFQS